MNPLLEICCNTIGAAHVLSEPDDIAPYLTDWRRVFTGSARAVLSPGSTKEVAQLVKLCREAHIPIVPQGGNTGLVQGSIPDSSGNAVIISTKRLNTIRNMDIFNNTITVEAGCVLAEVQNAAQNANRLYPLSLGSEGSCTIGGNLSTNAGGTAVLRYGNTRELCLGLEVVTSEGELWNSLNGLRKDNTGYDLRDLFIGAEGTLGIITAATLKLFPRPKSTLTALFALRNTDLAVQLFIHAQDTLGSLLTGFELISLDCIRLVEKHFPQLRAPFLKAHPEYVLLEISDQESQEHAQMRFETMVEIALSNEIIIDAAIASSMEQAQQLWRLREHITHAQSAEGKFIKHDISVPISAIAELITSNQALLKSHFPGCKVICYGHLGDGNLHYNVMTASNSLPFSDEQSKIQNLIFDNVARFKGSISAEHGIGSMKRDLLPCYKSSQEIYLMRTIKNALDPLNLMNPGKVV